MHAARWPANLCCLQRLLDLAVQAEAERGKTVLDDLVQQRRAAEERCVLKAVDMFSFEVVSLRSIIMMATHSQLSCVQMQHAEGKGGCCRLDRQAGRSGTRAQEH